MECVSCDVLTTLTNAFEGLDQTMFDALASGVVRVGATITTLVLFIALAFRSQFGLHEQMGLEAANQMFATIFRIAIAMGFLTSFPVWHDVVLETIEQIATYSATLADADAVPSSDLNSPHQQALKKTEFAIFDPLSRMMQAATTAFGWETLFQGATVMLGIIILMMFAVLDMAVLLLYYAEFQLWKFLVGGFGPFIIFAWVFEQTRGAAWQGLKILLQSALTIMLASGVVRITIEVFDTMAKHLPVQQDQDDPFGSATQPEELLGFMTFDGFGHAFMIQILVFCFLVLVKLMALFVVFGAPGSGLLKMVGAKR